MPVDVDVDDVCGTSWHVMSELSQNPLTPVWSSDQVKAVNSPFWRLWMFVWAQGINLNALENGIKVFHVRAFHCPSFSST
jgi:hypothetical protein